MNLARSKSGLACLVSAAAACLLAVAPALAQPVSFTTGPAGLIDDPTVPKVLDPVTGLNRAGTGKVLAADLNRSGRADVVVGPNLDGLLPTVAIPVRVLRSGGGGTFSDATRQLFGAGALPQTVWTAGISAGDFNRDGKLDLFFADSGNDRYPTTGATNVLLESTAVGTYVDRSATLPSLPDYSHSAASTDVDGDGILDIYVGNIVPPQPGACPYLLLRKADGTSVRVSSTLPATIADCTEQYTAAHLVDVDNDGHADLVLGKWLANSAASIVLPNDGHGDFTTRPRVALPASVFAGNTVVLAIAHVDANGDGYPDLLLASTANYVGGAIQLLINQGNGTFVDETAARLGPRATVLTGYNWDQLSVADINGDGRPDILAQSYWGAAGAPADFAWINNGNGTFAPVAVTGLSPPLNGKIVLTDANGDGRLDLVSVTYKWDDGNLLYQTYLNATPRTVPGEPIIAGGAAGDAQATVSFKAPLSSGSSAITSYTATCRFGSSTGTATGAASPLVVTGLVNDRPYLCSVTATNGAGTSLPSDVVTVRPGTCAGFSDVDNRSTFCPNVEWLKNRAITMGCTSSTLYCPGNAVSRLAMAAFMNRLGTALTGAVLWREEAPGALDLDASIVACQTDDFPLSTYPRRAFLDSVLSGTSNSQVGFASELVASFDAGVSWSPISAAPSRATAPANRWGNVRGNGSIDLPASATGLTVRFGLRAGRDGLPGTDDLSASRCVLRVSVGNRNGAVSPYDAQ